MTCVESTHQINIDEILPQLKERGITIVYSKEKDFAEYEGHPSHECLMMLQSKEGAVPIRVGEIHKPGSEDKLVIWYLIGHCNPKFLPRSKMMELNNNWLKEKPESPFRMAVDKKGFLIIGVAKPQENVDSEALINLISELTNSVPEIKKVVKSTPI